MARSPSTLLNIPLKRCPVCGAMVVTVVAHYYQAHGGPEGAAKELGVPINELWKAVQWDRDKRKA